MVATPWGDSRRLKGRRLPPGRATPSREVLESQRTRIFAAMVAAISKLGYAAAGVAEVSEIAGVSTRTFYDLFPGGKEECFTVVLGEILKDTLSALCAAGREEVDWERRLAAIYGRFARIVAEQPAAAGLVLIEAYAAGPAAAKALEKATRAFERLSREQLEESPEQVGLPPAMVEAQVGALQELARTRLRQGRADELPALVPELVGLVSGYRPPPERLRPGDRGAAVEADGVTSAEVADRAIRGFTLAVAEYGYSATTIRQIAKLGSMSLDTFYATFPGKREVLLAAVDSSTAQMQAIAMAAYRRTPGWSTGVRAALGSALGFLAARPATAKLLLAEVYAGGPEALRVRADGLADLAGILEEGSGGMLEVPAVAPEAIVGGIVALARRRFLQKGAERLSSLAPVATYIALAPYLGPEEACRVANGDRRIRPSEDRKSGFPRVPVRTTKWVIISLLGDRWASAEEIADEIGVSVVDVTAQLEELEQDRQVERMDPVDGKGPAEWTNTKRFRVLDRAEWAALTPGERKSVTEKATKALIADLAESMRRGALGTRLDEHHTRLILELDQEGWDELAEIHRAAFNASQAVREKSEERLRKSGGEALAVRSVQLLFEAPDEEALEGARFPESSALSDRLA